MKGKSKVLITGGAGFIGSHLCDLLLTKGFTVICLDNLITGSMDNIKHNIKNPRFKFIKHDISKPIEIPGGIDYVLHFASPASPRDYEKYPIETLKAGALGTHNALGIAKKKKARFLLASTSEVYGDPLVSPQKETYWGNVNSIGPRSCYDEAKRFAEAITMAYFRRHGVNTGIVRIFNTYGPRMRKNDGRVVPNFINQALEDRPLTVFGKGSQTRSFCYISDLVEGIYRMMFSNEHNPVNLGNPHEFTVLELARLVLKMIKGKGFITFKKLPLDDPRQRRPDISRALKLLKWRPSVQLREGLVKTIEWFRK